MKLLRVIEKRDVVSLLIVSWVSFFGQRGVGKETPCRVNRVRCEIVEGGREK